MGCRIQGVELRVEGEECRVEGNPVTVILVPPVEKPMVGSREVVQYSTIASSTTCIAEHLDLAVT